MRSRRQPPSQARCARWSSGDGPAAKRTRFPVWLPSPDRPGTRGPPGTAERAPLCGPGRHRRPTPARYACVATPDALRGRLRGLTTCGLVTACGRLRLHADWDIETSATGQPARLARRIPLLDAEIADHTGTITTLVGPGRPDPLDRCAGGPMVAATVRCAWSHPGRCRTDAAFAMAELGLTWRQASSSASDYAPEARHPAIRSRSDLASRGWLRSMAVTGLASLIRPGGEAR
jgi:hypothetical protein